MILTLRQSGELISEFLLDVGRFPWWWYSDGTKLVVKWCWRGFEETRWKASLGMFLKHFFSPMYGDYSRSGRAISLLMRAIMVVGKLIHLAVTALWYALLLVGWILLLPFIMVVIFI